MPIQYLDEVQPGKVQFLDDGRDSTGEEVLQFVAQDPSYAQRMTRDEFLQMRQYKEANPVSFGTKVAEAFGGIGDIVGKAFTTAPKFADGASPLEKGVSLAANIGQGAAVGLGDFSQLFLSQLEGYSNDNNSYSRYLRSKGEKDTPENKAKYNEAVDRELEGFRALQQWQIDRKNLLGQASMPAAAEAISLGAQPPLPGAAALEAFGVGERLGTLGAQAAQAVGRGVQAGGEAIGAAARVPQQMAGVAAKALTGSEEAANRVEQMVARGSTGLAAGHLGLGLSVPGLSAAATAVAGAKLAGKGLEVAGEVTQKLAENAGKGASRIGTFEALANDLSASTAARTIGRLGFVGGGDIVAPYIAAAARGAAEGAAIGGVLGFIADGEDGAAGGIGSGLALGLGGGLIGRAYAQGSGMVRRANIAGDAVRSNVTLDPESRTNAASLFDRLIKDGNHEAVAELVDTRNWLSGDVDFKYIPDSQAKAFAAERGISFEGATATPPGEAKPTIYINVDKVQPGTGFHEAFHGAMRTALGETFKGKFAEIINSFTPEQKASFLGEYIDRGGTEAGKQRIRDYLAANDNLPEEFGAEYFRRFLQKRENRDLLLRGTRSADGSLIAATKSAIDFTLDRIGVTGENTKTGYKGMDGLVGELVKARTDINRAIAENGKPVVSVPLDRMPTQKLGDWAQQQGQGDVLLKDAAGKIVGVKTEEQVNTARDAAYQRAAEEIANVPRGTNAPNSAELAIYAKHLAPDHAAKLTFLTEAMKSGNVINGDYFPASVKSGEQSVYASRGMTNRDFVPYKIRTTKKGVVVVDFLDVTQLKARFDDMMARKGVVEQWGGDREAAWNDVINYSKNLSLGDGVAKPSAELFGATKRDIINKVYGFVPTKAQLDTGAIRNASALGLNNRRESGTGKDQIGKPAYQDSKDTRAVSSMRLDRIGKLVETKRSFPFNESGSYGLSQVNFRPAENLPHGKVYQSDEGAKILESNGRFILHASDGKRVGVFGSAAEATAKAERHVSVNFMPEKYNTPEFKRWFAKSKVVDAQGNPLVVYHGTDSDIPAFAKKMLGHSTGAESANMGFWWTNNPRVASNYADYAARDGKIRRLMAKADALEKAGKWDEYDKAVQEYEKLDADLRNTAAGQNVIPAHLSIQNPAIMDAKGEVFTAIDDKIKTFIKSAKNKGHDGVIIRNLDDAPGLSNAVADHFIVFEPNQIKSATGNNGKFNPADPRINFMPETLPNGTVHKTDSGFSVVNRSGGAFRVYDPQSKLVGVVHSLDEAEKLIRRRSK